jgi:hypothetical protein
VWETSSHPLPARTVAQAFGSLRPPERGPAVALECAPGQEILAVEIPEVRRPLLTLGLRHHALALSWYPLPAAHVPPHPAV